MYESTLMWIYGINKTLEAGHSIKDGRFVTKMIINSTIPGKLYEFQLYQNK